MTKLAVALVHGIGAQTYHWADGLIDRLRVRVWEEAGALLGGSQPLPDPSEMLALVQVHWADVLQEHQRQLQTILAGGPRVVTARVPWWHAVVHPIRYARSQLRQAQATFIAEFIGDIIGYLDQPTKAAVHEAMTGALQRLATRMAPAPGKWPLTVIAHSLGTVITSDYIWDAAKARRRAGQDGFHDAWRLENFFTVGSPLALFALKYGGAEVFSSPIAVESGQGRWINIYDDDDPIAMPLKPLNAAYGRSVWKDAEVNAGAYLFAHGGYFTEPQTLTIISRKLALDWLAANQRLPEAQARALYARYDDGLGIA